MAETENKKMVHPCDGTCSRCGCYTDRNDQAPYRRIKIGAFSSTLCNNCFKQLYLEMGKALGQAVELNDQVWELTKCDDDVWRIFPMKIKSISEHGSLRQIKKHGTEVSEVWNIYAENAERYTYMYKSFYELGKTWFLTEQAAKIALTEKLNGAD